MRSLFLNAGLTIVAARQHSQCQSEAGDDCNSGNDNSLFSMLDSIISSINVESLKMFVGVIVLVAVIASSLQKELYRVDEDEVTKRLLGIHKQSCPDPQECIYGTGMCAPAIEFPAPPLYMAGFCDN